MLAISLALCVISATTVAGTDALHRGRSDFAATYLTAQLWSADHDSPLYDQSLQAGRFRSVSLDPSGYLPFLNPPMAAVVAAPLASLDFASAYFVWAAIQAVLLVAAVVTAVLAAPWPSSVGAVARAATAAAALASYVVLVEVGLGQYDGPLALGIAAAYAAWRAERPLLAGLAIGLTAGLAKPHLALGLLAFLIGRRDWRALGGAIVGGLAWLVATLLLVPWSTIAAYPQGALAGDASTRPPGIISAYGPAATLLGEGGAAIVAAALAALLLAGAAAWLGTRSRLPAALETGLSGAVLASLLIPPHVRYYDLVLLAPLLPLALAALSRARGRMLPRDHLLLAGWLGFGALAVAVDGPDDTVAAFVLFPLLLVGLLGTIALARRPRTIET